MWLRKGLLRLNDRTRGTKRPKDAVCNLESTFTVFPVILFPKINDLCSGCLHPSNTLENYTQVCHTSGATYVSGLKIIQVIEVLTSATF